MASIGLILIVVAFVSAFLVAFVVMKRATRLGLVQHPNARSSHVVPTPTGGGLGLVVGGTLSGLLMLLLLPWLAVPILMASLLIALLGYWDDRKPLPASWRLGAQVLLMGAMIAVLPLEGLARFTGLDWPEWALMLTFTLLGALWLNLFNFMDGIDGLAGSEAITILLSATLLAYLGHPDAALHPLFWWMLGLAAATTGFMLLNWPPARLFMGDVGSTYLGLMIAFFAFASISGGWLSAPQWLIVSTLFWADGLTTLFRRLLLKEPVWQAHRRHAYQRLARRWSHARVTGLAIGLNLVVLLPVAYVAALVPDWAWPLAIVTVLGFMGLSYAAGAGAPLDAEA
jgi:Fuc2NAc and GlcNAc transferase